MSTINDLIKVKYELFAFVVISPSDDSILSSRTWYSPLGLLIASEIAEFILSSKDLYLS